MGYPNSWMDHSGECDTKKNDLGVPFQETSMYMQIM